MFAYGIKVFSHFARQLRYQFLVPCGGIAFLFGSESSTEVMFCKYFSNVRTYDVPSKSSRSDILKKVKRKIQGVPQQQAATLPRHQEEEETDKTKQAQLEQTYEKHFRLALSSPSEVIAMLKGLENTRAK